jgi:hypothetical protein
MHDTYTNSFATMIVPVARLMVTTASALADTSK